MKMHLHIKYPPQDEQHKRDLSLDLIKTIAMFSVVSLHTTCLFQRNILTLIVGYTSLIAIPLFFVVSGYLMFARENVSYRYIGFKIYNIVKYIFICSIALFVLMSIVHRSLDLSLLVDTFLGSFIQKGLFGVFWYFGSMIIIYIILPTIHMLYRNEFRSFLILVLLLLLASEIIQVANVLDRFESYIPQTFRVWNWLLYFCIGGIVFKYQSYFSKLSFSYRWSLFVWLIFIAYSVAYHPISWATMGEYYYSSLPLCVLVVTLFLNIKYSHISENKYRDVIKMFSSLFLPVYTLHQFVIIAIGRFSIWSEWYIGGFIEFLFVSIISVLISYCLVSTPYVKEVFKL